MSTVTEQLQALRNEQQSIKTRLIGVSANDIVYSALGEVVVFGCKVTEGDDDSDMVVALEGEAAGDESHQNPDLEASPVHGFQYPNRASLKGGAFSSLDQTATVEDPPTTGQGRYDIAYIYMGPYGAGFGIATGSASVGVKTDFDGSGLDTDPYLHSGSFDPSLPIGAMPIARIYVEDDEPGIVNARIADLRVFSDLSYAQIAQYYAEQAQASSEAVGDMAEASEQWAITPVDVPVLASGSAMEFSSLHWATKSADSAAESEQWSITPEDVPVPASGSAMDYSSLHWAAKSEGFAVASSASADDAEQWAITPVDVPVPASGSAMEYSSLHWATKSADSAAESEQWAITAEDTPVPASGSDMEYSALHWAAKAEDFADAAETAQVGAEDALAETEQALADATAIVYGGAYSTTPTAGNVPIAHSNGRLDDGWLGPNSITNPKALSQMIHLTAAGSGSNGIQVLSNAQLNPGVYDFTETVTLSINDYTPSAQQTLARKHDGTNGYIFLLNTNGTLSLTLNATTYTSTVAPVISDADTVTFAYAVTRETASVAGVVRFVCNGVQVGADVAITAGTATTCRSSANHYVLGTSAVRTAGRALIHRFYNLALTVAELLLDAKRGVIYDYISAGINRMSSASVSAWTVSGVTISAATHTAPDGTVLDTMVETAASAGHLVLLTGGTAPLMRGKVVFRAVVKAAGRRYVTFRTNMTQSSASNWSYVQFDLQTGAVSVEDINGGLSSNWASRAFRGAIEPLGSDFYNIMVYIGVTAVELTGFSSRNARITMEDAVTSADGGGDPYLGDGVSGVAIGGIQFSWLGCTAQYEPEGIQMGGQWHDKSGNKNHALAPSAGATVIRRKNEFEIRDTRTWAGTHELQYIGGFNQAILPANAYIESIVGVISGATIEDIIIGDGSDTDRFVAITTGLAAGTTSFTLASRIPDGTNYKLTVDPDANFTGSIAFVIRGYLLEP